MQDTVAYNNANNLRYCICAVECRLSDSAQATQLLQSHELKRHIKNSGQVSFFSQMEFPDERKLLANVREALLFEQQTSISIQPTRLIAMNHFIAMNTLGACP